MVQPPRPNSCSLAEVNPCHNPAGPGGGQFCSKGGSSAFMGLEFDPATGAMDLEKMARVRTELKQPVSTRVVDPARVLQGTMGRSVTPEQAQGIADAVTAEMGKGSGRVTVAFVPKIRGRVRGDYDSDQIRLAPDGQTTDTLLHELAHWAQDHFKISGGTHHRQGFEQAHRVVLNAFVRTRRVRV